MASKQIRYYWLGFVVALAGVIWLLWLWRKQKEVVPAPLYIRGRTSAYPMVTHKESEPKVDDLKVIQGIGPAYAQRLNEAGISTFYDLATSEPEDTAKRTGLSISLVSKWIDQANELEGKS